ncbi:MAG: hotdog fold domain-containing protein [Desulfobacteraceae bacterium]|nr:hotdog fold domain-containing protein [Desulfobacteraceae bacterium]
MPNTLQVYNKLSKLPFGNQIFTRALTFKTPYFSTIHPLIVDVRPGYCRVEMPDRHGIRNHLSTIHAGALCNLCELTGGLAVEVSAPANLRWIPKEMTVQYLKKAKGKLTGICSFDPEILTAGDVPIPLEIKNASGEAVLSARIVFYLTPRR